MSKKRIFRWLKHNLYVSVPAFLTLSVALAFAVIVYMGNNSGFAKSGNYPVLVKSGMSTWEISELLHAKGLVRHPKAFRIEARVRGLARKLQAGLYVIEGGMSNGEIVERLSKGRVKMARLTVPEGYCVRQVGTVIEQAGFGSAERFCKLAKTYAPYGYMKTDNADVIYKAEGFLYPAVYDFPASYNEKDLLELMVRTFDEEVTKAGCLRQAKQLGKNFRDVVNLAAMVEKEAVFRSEQPRIAGVFQNRLDIWMPIQSDTTVQYILGGEQREIILYRDTKIENPYNTYQNYGLPPGPIASPGMSAIKAALQPEKTDYLYFVAEKDGHHRFSTCYADHLQAIDDIECGR